MFHIHAGLFLAVSTLSESTSCLWGGPPPRAADIQVYSYNYALLAPAVLKHAQAIATEKFRLAGIYVDWRTCSGDGNRSGCKGRADGPNVLILGLLPEQMVRRIQTAPWQFGLAATGDGQSFPFFPVHAYVFVSRAADFSNSESVPMPVVLGTMIAHEIGHLLLGSDSHCHAGIMRPKWSHADVRNATMGGLTFNSEQAAHMREDVRRRNSTRTIPD